MEYYKGMMVCLKLNLSTKEKQIWRDVKPDLFSGKLVGFRRLICQSPVNRYFNAFCRKEQLTTRGESMEVFIVNRQQKWHRWHAWHALFHTIIKVRELFRMALLFRIEPF